MMSHFKICNFRKRASFQRYLGISILIHSTLCLLILFGIFFERNKVKNQEDIFVQNIVEEELRIKEEEQQARDETNKELIADQILSEVDNWIDDQLDPEKVELLLENTEDSLYEWMNEMSNLISFESFSTESLEDLSQTLHQKAFETLQADLQKMKQDLLLHQVRSFIRKQVAPEIKREFDDQLKKRVGEQLKQTVTNQLRQEKTDSATSKKIAKTALPELEQAVREQVEKELQAVTIPVAAERMVKTLHHDLKRRGLNDQAFQTFLENDISSALQEAMAEQAPASEVALLKTKQQFKHDSSALEAARQSVEKAALTLSSLAEQEAVFREDIPDETPSRDAQKQYKLADEIRTARKQAIQAVDVASRVSLQANSRLSKARRQLSGTTIEKTAVHAAQAMEREVVADARKMMDQVSQNLRMSVQTLEQLNQALAKEIKTLAPTDEPPHETTVEKEVEKTASQIAEKAKPVIQREIHRAAKGIAHAVDIKNSLGDEATLEALSKMDSLEARLDHMEKNSKEGRPSESGFDLIGPGQGILPPGRSSYEDLPWALPYRRTTPNFNLIAYQDFVKEMRGRLDPDTYYNEIEDVEPWAASPELKTNRTAAVIFVEPPPSIETNEISVTRTIPTPSFKTKKFGAAAMMETLPIIDGDLSDWGELRHGLDLRYIATSTTPVENGPTLFVRWSPEGLYFAYIVDDPNGIQACPNVSWGGDCIEVMVDMANSRRPQTYLNEEAQKFELTPFGCRGNKNHTLWEMGRGLRGLKMETSYPDTDGIKGRSAAKIHPGGYSVEGFISRRALANPTFVPGKYIGLNASINRGNHATSYQWSASKRHHTWRHPETWGDLLLLGSDAHLLFTEDETSEEPSRGIVMGEPLFIRIQDADMNLNTRKIDRISVELVVKDGGASLFVVLTETDVNTGLFRAAVQTQAYFMEPKEQTLNIRNGCTLQLIYTDTRSEYGEKNRKTTADLPVGWPVMTLGNGEKWSNGMGE